MQIDAHRSLRRALRECGQLLTDIKTDTTSIIVTHDTEFVEKIAPKGVLMEAGKVVERGQVEDIVRGMKE